MDVRYIFKLKSDPVHDLEMTKYNLRKFIYDENNNDIHLINKINRKNTKQSISMVKVRLFKVVQLLLQAAHMAGLRRPEAIFVKAIKTVEINQRKKRSIEIDDDISLSAGDSENFNGERQSEIERQVLSKIFRGLDDLKIISSSKKESLLKSFGTTLKNKGSKDKSILKHNIF